MTNFNRAESLRAIYENMNRMYEGAGAGKCVLSERDDSGFDEDNMTDRDYDSFGYGIAGANRRRKSRNLTGGFGDEDTGREFDDEEQDFEEEEGEAPVPSRKDTGSRGDRASSLTTDPVPAHWQPTRGDKRVVLPKSDYAEGAITDTYFGDIGDIPMENKHNSTLRGQVASVINKILGATNAGIDQDGKPQGIMSRLDLNLSPSQTKGLSKVLANYFLSDDSIADGGFSKKAHEAIYDYGKNLKETAKRSDQYDEPPERGTGEFESMAANPKTRSFIGAFNSASKQFGVLQNKLKPAILKALTGDRADEFIDAAVNLTNAFRQTGNFQRMNPLTKEEEDEYGPSTDSLWDDEAEAAASSSAWDDDPAIKQEMENTRKSDEELESDDDKYEGPDIDGEDDDVFDESHDKFGKLFNGLYKAIYG